MSKKTYKKQFICIVLSATLFLSGLVAGLPNTAQVQAQTQSVPNLPLKIKAYNYCLNVIVKAATGSPSTANPVTENTPNAESFVDQSGILSSPCATGYLAGFFGTETKAATCSPNFVNNPGGNPLIPGTPLAPGTPPPRTPTNAQEKKMCRDAYDVGSREQGNSIKTVAKQSEDVCNKTDKAKQDQCKKDLEKCNNKPNNQKLGCFQKLATDYPEATDAAGDSPATCEDEGGLLGWIICPIITTASNFSDYAFQEIIAPMLEKIPVSADPTDNSYKSWQGFRFLANVMLIGTLLAIIYSQARGGE